MIVLEQVGYDVVLQDRLSEAGMFGTVALGLLRRRAAEVAASTSVCNFSRSPSVCFLVPSCWPYSKLAGLSEQVDST